MTRITFIAPGKGEYHVEAQPGQSVMEAATGNLVPGIIGECGGSCACATCHVYVDEAWIARLPPPDEMEKGMLEGAVDPGPLSRLSCQIRITDALDGLVLRIPEGQL
ncbi:2Fe-2S iron-sulfur cluster-binding protein [Fontimonas sp. SYSU GA230001]|uniref:2Fe-2S iron-sulfur cluster-binding protein n=1 Tax=Fontimonas sp. SYSU GA230001 TaxID=3142450 RepID=UPI0032B510E9